MTLTYNDKGKGNVLVLLHGFCEDKSIWDGFIDTLATQNRVLAIDLPGFGETKAVQEISIEQAADAVKATLEMLKVEHCIMIGHSLGGYVSLAFAEKYDDMLRGMGLFHSSAMADTEEKKSARDKTVEFIQKNGLKQFAQSFVEPLFYPKNRSELQQEIGWMKEKVAACVPDTVVAYLKAMRDRPSRLEVIQSVKVPVLYIVGKEDNAVPLESSLEQCYLPKDAVVQFLGGTAHMGMIEKKNETLKTIQLFTSYCS